MRFPVLLACTWAALALHASDWPQWRGPSHDGHAPVGAGRLSRLPETPRIPWEIPAGEGLASPVIAGGRVFAFDNPDALETLRALDAATGRELWAVGIDKPFSDSQGPTGPRNTPVVDGDRVYAVSCRGELQCRRVTDGTLVWKVNYVRDFQAVFMGETGNAPGATRHGNNGSPLIDGDHLIACVGGTNGAGVVCFEKRTGAVVWKSTSDQAGYAPPLVATFQDRTQVVCFQATGVVGLDRANGEVLWRVPIRTAFGRHAVTPIIAGDHVIVSSHQAGLLGIKVKRENNTWSAKIAWTRKDAAINFSSPVATGGFLYGVGPNRDVLCVELSTGRTAWSQPGLFVTSADKAYAGLILVGSNILMLTDSGELILFAASPDQWQELGRVQVCSLNWCNPALADGVLYLRDGLKKNGHWMAVRLLETNG